MNDYFGDGRVSTAKQGEGVSLVAQREAIETDAAQQAARVTIDGESTELTFGQLSGWVTLTFKAVPGIKVSGICRLMVTEMGDQFSLYMTPLNLDPEKPAMPISHPSYYSTYLAKKIGPYATLGLS